MIKFLLILLIGGALANGLSPKEPPLLIDTPTASGPLDAAG